MEAPREGLVLRIDAKVCHVEIDGQRHSLPLAGKLFEERSHEKKPLAVGDRVRIRFEPGGAAIDELLPRSSQISRRAASEGEARAQVVAANITLVIAAASIAEPPLQPELIDGVLAAARREHIDAAVVLTKQDRDRDGRGAACAELYRSLGHQVFFVSTHAGHRTEPELTAIGELLHRNRTVICGLSGVGKSSLLNAVIPGLDLRIGTLSHIRQGKHTTSHTELIPLPGGGHVLDTPGVRSFHLFHVGSQELQFLLPEIGALLPQCGYRNCLHQDEPDCAVAAAVATGAIAKSRYESYRRMLDHALAAESPPRGDDERQGRGRRRPPSR